MFLFALTIDWLEIRGTPERWLFGTSVFMISSIIGSYLNVVIHRLPAGLSVAFPGSRCPWCQKPIRAFDNIPIFSWFFLFGRCRNCKTGISFRYPLIEATVAFTLTWLFVRTVIGQGKHLPFAQHLSTVPTSDLRIWLLFAIHGLLWCTLISWAMTRFDGSRVTFRLFRPAILLVFAGLVMCSWGPAIPNSFESIDLPVVAPAIVGGLLGAIFGCVAQFSDRTGTKDQFAWLTMGLVGLCLGTTAIISIAMVASLLAVCLAMSGLVNKRLGRFDWSIVISALVPIYLGFGSLIQSQLNRVGVGPGVQQPNLAYLIFAIVIGAIALIVANRIRCTLWREESDNSKSWTSTESNWPRRAPQTSLERQNVTPDLQENLKRIVESPTYRLAEKDIEFIKRPELRPLRVQLELAKPEMILNEQGVTSTIVAFGGTQVVDQEEAEKRLADAKAAAEKSPNDKELAREVLRSERRLAKSRFYEDAREFARLVSSTCQTDGKCEYVVITGGGPGIMEAGNRGAYEAGAKSIGLNITLPDEQHPNPYITPELCFQFHYFALRKMHFLLRAKALIVFPGGFGTLDELFCALTLRQTGRMQAIPIILYGREYWENVIDFQFLADEGVIADHHMDLIDFAETPQQAWDIITKFHG